MNLPPRQRRRTDAVPEAGETQRLLALIADDDPDFGAWIGVLAARLGFTVVYAVDGDKALQALRERSFDLLLIDYAMPRVNGLAVIEAIRADEKWSDSYAVMITAYDDVDSKLRALGAGFDDFLGKSSSEAEIVAKLSSARRMLARYRTLGEAVRRLHRLATRDELTGVFNRRFFQEEAEKTLAERGDVSVVIFDLDEFKTVNDTWGHLAGDQVLRDTGALFLRATRTEDLVARYGGDEFVLLVTGLEVSQVESIAARISRQIGELRWTVAGRQFRIGASTGIATAALLGEPSLQRLLEAADRDLYKNKWIRKNPDLDPAIYEYPERGGATILLRPETGQPRSEVVALGPPPPPVQKPIAGR